MTRATYAICAALAAGACNNPTDQAPVATAPATVLYQERVVAIERTLPDPDDLWVPARDLRRINDFELTSRGACLNDRCVDVPRGDDSDMFVRSGGEDWISVTALARQLQQEFAVDHDHAVWSFGTIPAAQTAFTQAAMAPDFALPNQEGRLVRLSDFRGKKVLIITWASW
jgi:hypothetical protein